MTKIVVGEKTTEIGTLRLESRTRSVRFALAVVTSATALMCLSKAGLAQSPVLTAQHGDVVTAPPISATVSNSGSKLYDDGDPEIRRLHGSDEQTTLLYLGFMKTADNFAAKGQWVKAAEGYNNALKVGYTASQQAYYGLSRCAEAQGKMEEAVNAYRKGVDYKRPIPQNLADSDSRQTAYAMREDDPYRLAKFVILLTDAGHPEEAYSTYCRLADIVNQPNDPKSALLSIPIPDRTAFESKKWEYTPQHVEAMAYIVEASDHVHYWEEKDEQLGLLQQAVKLAPHSALPYFYLGELLGMKFREKPHERSEAYQTALRYDYGANRVLIERRLQ